MAEDRVTPAGSCAWSAARSQVPSAASAGHDDRRHATTRRRGRNRPARRGRRPPPTQRPRSAASSCDLPEGLSPVDLRAREMPARRHCGITYDRHLRHTRAANSPASEGESRRVGEQADDLLSQDSLTAGCQRGPACLRIGRRPRRAGPRQDRAPRRPRAAGAGPPGAGHAAQGRPGRRRQAGQRRPRRGPAQLRRAPGGAARRARRGRPGGRGHRRHAALDPSAGRRAPPDHDPGRAHRRHLRRDGLGAGRGPRGRDRAVQLRRAELPAGPPGPQRVRHLPHRAGRIAAAAAHPHLAGAGAHAARP